MNLQWINQKTLKQLSVVFPECQGGDKKTQLVNSQKKPFKALGKALSEVQPRVSLPGELMLCSVHLILRGGRGGNKQKHRLIREAQFADAYLPSHLPIGAQRVRWFWSRDEPGGGRRVEGWHVCLAATAQGKPHPGGQRDTNRLPLDRHSQKPEQVTGWISLALAVHLFPLLRVKALNALESAIARLQTSHTRVTSESSHTGVLQVQVCRPAAGLLPTFI